MDKHRSGSPRAQQERQQQYRKQSGPVSNPGDLSLTNRKARRALLNLLPGVAAKALSILSQEETDDRPC